MASQVIPFILMKFVTNPNYNRNNIYNSVVFNALFAKPYNL